MNQIKYSIKENVIYYFETAKGSLFSFCPHINFSSGRQGEEESRRGKERREAQAYRQRKYGRELLGGKDEGLYT